MVRIHDPNHSNNKSKVGTDNQLHGGMMETADQFANLINQTVENVGSNNKEDNKNNSK